MTLKCRDPRWSHEVLSFKVLSSKVLHAPRSRMRRFPDPISPMLKLVIWGFQMWVKVVLLKELLFSIGYVFIPLKEGIIKEEKVVYDCCPYYKRSKKEVYGSLICHKEWERVCMTLLWLSIHIGEWRMTWILCDGCVSTIGKFYIICLPPLR